MQKHRKRRREKRKKQDAAATAETSTEHAPGSNEIGSEDKPSAGEEDERSPRDRLPQSAMLPTLLCAVSPCRVFARVQQKEL